MKKAPTIKKSKVHACKKSSLVTPKKDIKLSLGKVSEKTKVRSSSFDIFVG